MGSAPTMFLTPLKATILICILSVMATGAVSISYGTLVYTAPVLAALIWEVARVSQRQLNWLRLALAILAAAGASILNLYQAVWRSRETYLLALVAICVLTLFVLDIFVRRAH